MKDLSRVIWIMILQFFERFMLSVSLSMHYGSVGDSSESCSEVCIMVEHDFYLMSEWMSGTGVTPSFTCVPESMSNYPIIRLSVMYEDVSVYDLI